MGKITSFCFIHRPYEQRGIGIFLGEREVFSSKSMESVWTERVRLTSSYVPIQNAVKAFKESIASSLEVSEGDGTSEAIDRFRADPLHVEFWSYPHYYYVTTKAVLDLGLNFSSSLKAEEVAKFKRDRRTGLYFVPYYTFTGIIPGALEASNFKQCKMIDDIIHSEFVTEDGDDLFDLSLYPKRLPDVGCSICGSPVKFHSIKGWVHKEESDVGHWAVPRLDRSIEIIFNGNKQPKISPTFKGDRTKYPLKVIA